MICGIVLLGTSVALAQESRIIRDSLPTELVSADSVEYGVLLPDGYSKDGGRLPLVLMLHGAGGDREELARFEPQIRQMWADSELPELVIATPSVAAGSIYMDSHDGKDRWETFIMTELLPHLRQDYRVGDGRETTMVTGISMGGLGSLRLGFKYPEIFGAVAAMEPGAWPGLTWHEVPDRNKIRSPDRIANLFGNPFDHGRFRQENPASIVQNDPSRLEGSAIYLEVGDEDGFGFMEGVDYMHRLLWRHRIRHEYRLVRWADHVGSTVMERSRDRFRFLARFLAQPEEREPAVKAFRARMAESHRSRGMQPFGFWPNSTLRSYSSGDRALDYQRAIRDSVGARKEHGVIRITDIPYAGHRNGAAKRQVLDVYLQEGLVDAPAVLYVHGGGWIRGDKERALFKPAALVPEGYLFASMNYRFRPAASLADMAQDVATAAVWLKRHARNYGGDPSKIVLMGHSAGAHLVSVVASNPSFMDAAGASIGDLSGVIAIDTAMLHVPLRMETAGESQYRVFGRNSAAWTRFSPWHHVTQGVGIPPFLFLISDGREVSRRQATVMQNKLLAARIEASTYEGRGRAHTPLDTYIGIAGDESTQVIMDFLDRHSKASLPFAP